MSVAPEHERFAKNTTIMAQAIFEGVKRLYDAGYKTVNPSTIEFAVAIISAFDKHNLIQGFIENSHVKCWDNIKKRNEQFFVENSGEIFKYLPTENVNLFKDLFLTKDSTGKSVVSQGLKDQLWSLLDANVKISIKYVHNNRSPYSYSTSDGVSNAYGTSFFDNVDIAHHANVWNVRLEFPPNF